MYQRLHRSHPRASVADQFGVRSAAQVARDVRTVVAQQLGARAGGGFAFDASTAGFFRPDLSLPAYAGLVPADGISPIYHFFDRVGGGRGYRYAVTRTASRDWRGGRLTYDEHDGTDFVCPPGTPLVAAAPGVVVALRDSFLRGGLTACVDHGAGVVTQYTHLSRAVAEVGAELRRGDVVGLSGSAGIDMVLGFPWVPPHVHFMVWVRGRPVDPYLADGEAERAGTWVDRNDPRAAGPLASDAPPPRLASIAIDEREIDRVAALAKDSRVAAEIAGASAPASRVAILEDSLHHERDAWPAGADASALRPAADASAVRLTLPLAASVYRAARAADAPWTRPQRA